jgi:hypothetical protein
MDGSNPTDIGAGIKGFWFDISRRIGDNVERPASAKLVFSKSDLGPLVDPGEFLREFSVNGNEGWRPRHYGING